MKRQTIVHEDWIIYLYYNVSHEDTSDIIDSLMDIGCVSRDLNRAYDSISCMGYNRGLTYANPKTKEAVVVIGKASSRKEFLNTLVHELYHCCSFILNGDLEDIEYPAYVLGDLAQKVYNDVHPMLCEKCR